MASDGYYDWLHAGKPFTLAVPLDDLRKALQGHGYTVYAYPDESHQLADPPEDHTPYSETGWPAASPRWWGTAVDVMPKGGDARELTPMARQIIADKDAGVPGIAWLKYINWTDEHGSIWHTSWEPSKRTVPSGDGGHLHLSGRSDMVTTHLQPYDPIGRMSGDGVEGEDEDMGMSTPPIDILKGEPTSLTLVGTEDSGADPRAQWLRLNNDTFGNDYALRIAVGNGAGGFRVALVKFKSNVKWSMQLQKGETGISIVRAAIGQDGKPIDPMSSTPPPQGSKPAYAGHLTCVIERGPVVR